MNETVAYLSNKVHVRALWNHRDVADHLKREQLCKYFSLIGVIDPTLSSFSALGKKLGWRPMLDQPQVQCMGDLEWTKLFDQSRKDGCEILAFWNRRKDDSHRVYTHFLSARQLSEYDYCILLDLPLVLIDEKSLSSILAAMIEAFNPDVAEIATSEFISRPALQENTHDVIAYLEASRRTKIEGGYSRRAPCYGDWDTPVWQRWVNPNTPTPEPDPPLRSGKPVPDAQPSGTFLQRWQSEMPSNNRQFLNGSLQVWQEFSPWLLMGKSKEQI